MVRITVVDTMDDALARALADLHERTAVVAYAHIFDTPFPREETLARWSGYTGRVALAIEGSGGRFLGFVAWRGEHLDALYVLPDAAGSGIGSQLIGAAHGTRRLWVMEANTSARRFYEPFGWQPSGVTRPGYPGAPELEYVRLKVREVG